MSEDYITFDEVNSIEFADSVRWQMNFETAPSPFNVWFPATTFDPDVYAINTLSFKAGHSDFDLPSGFSARTMRLECADSEDLRLYNWLLNWKDNGLLVSSEGRQGMNYLADMCRKMQVKTLNGQNIVVRTEEYTVYPIGNLSVPHTQESGNRLLQLQFAIAKKRTL